MAKEFYRRSAFVLKCTRQHQSGSASSPGSWQALPVDWRRSQTRRRRALQRFVLAAWIAACLAE